MTDRFTTTLVNRGGPGVFREERAGRGAETGNAEGWTQSGQLTVRGGRGALRGMEEGRFVFRR